MTAEVNVTHEFDTVHEGGIMTGDVTLLSEVVSPTFDVDGKNFTLQTFGLLSADE